MARAKFRFIRMPQRKLIPIMGFIRGKKVDSAFNILKFTNRAGARIVEKLLRSAVDNAVKDEKLNEETLYISESYADPAPTLKRFMARAMGRPAMIRKRMCHATIVVHGVGAGKK